MSYAAMAAITIEGVLLAALVYTLSHRTVVVPGVHHSKIMLSFPVIAKPAPPKPKIKKPVVKPHPKPKPKPVHHVVHHRPISKPRPKPRPVAKPMPAPPKTVTVPQPPPRPSVSPDVMSLFEQQVHAAIQSALNYPYAARLAHISGRVQVSFTYRAGNISDIKILHGSPYAMLNTAAIKAVQSATYPTPPANLGYRVLQFEIWVSFRQVNSYEQ